MAPREPGHQFVVAKINIPVPAQPEPPKVEAAPVPEHLITAEIKPTKVDKFVKFDQD